MVAALYDRQAVRRFVGADLSRERALDAPTLLKFRRSLEAKKLTETILVSIKEHLAAKGMLLREVTVVHATIIAAP
jgi:IS5 family transposase